MLSTFFEYFPPLTNVWSLACIVLQCLWTYAVIEFVHEDFLDLAFDPGTIVSILTGTLGFILPLQLSAALLKNKSGIDQYSVFCNKAITFSWEAIALYNKKDSMDDKQLEKTFDIVVALPAILKHSFRGTVDLTKATTRNGVLLTKTRAGRKIQSLVQYRPEDDIIEMSLFKLMDYIKDLTASEQTQLRSPLLSAWDGMRSAWVKMSNLNAYKTPVIFTYVLNAALLLYIVFLPFTLLHERYNAIWMTGLIAYFFLGLRLAGLKVANAFAEGAKGFQTVTSKQKKTTKALQKIWDVRRLVFATENMDKIKL